MPYAVFNPDGEAGRTAWLGATVREERPVAVMDLGGPFRSSRVALTDLSRRVYSWPAGLTDLQRTTWLAFLQARGWTRDAFLVLDPWDEPREAVTLEPAVGDGAVVTFSLPTATSSPYYPDHPLAGRARGLVAGATAALASVNQDGRAVTFAAAPGLGLAVQLDYIPLRLVRLVREPDLQAQEHGYSAYQLELEEVLRD